MEKKIFLFVCNRDQLKIQQKFWLNWMVWCHIVSAYVYKCVKYYVEILILQKWTSERKYLHSIEMLAIILVEFRRYFASFLNSWNVYVRNSVRNHWIRIVKTTCVSWSKFQQRNSLICDAVIFTFCRNRSQSTNECKHKSKMLMVFFDWPWKTFYEVFSIGFSNKEANELYTKYV